mgnify:CR=1 FL=1
MSGGNTYKRKSHRRIEVITSVAAVVVLYVILESFGVTCPIKYITGISCAGCGMSRAWLALLHFDLKKAIYYHPLFWLPPVVVLSLLLKKNNAKLFKIILCLSAMLFLSVYVCRLIDMKESIVVFKPEDNIVFRIIRYI